MQKSKCHECGKIETYYTTTPINNEKEYRCVVCILCDENFLRKQREEKTKYKSYNFHLDGIVLCKL